MKNQIMYALMSFGLGFVACAAIAIWIIYGENQRFAETYAAQKQAIETANTTIDHLRDTIKRVYANGHANDGVYTVLIDKTGDGEAFAELQFINSTANGGLPDGDGRYIRIGRCWILPGRIIPESSDGDLGFLYGYINPDGSTSGWYTAARAK